VKLYFVRRIPINKLPYTSHFLLIVLNFLVITVSGRTVTLLDHISKCW